MYMITGKRESRGQYSMRRVQTQSETCARLVSTQLEASGCTEIYVEYIETPVPNIPTVTTVDLVASVPNRGESVDHIAFNIRLGKRIVGMLHYIAAIRNTTQSAYLLESIAEGLDTDMQSSFICLGDWSCAVTNRSPYTIRLDQGVLDSVQEKARELGVNRTTWIIWAILHKMRENGFTSEAFPNIPNIKRTKKNGKA